MRASRATQTLAFPCWRARASSCKHRPASELAPPEVPSRRQRAPRGCPFEGRRLADRAGRPRRLGASDRHPSVVPFLGDGHAGCLERSACSCGRSSRRDCLGCGLCGKARASAVLRSHHLAGGLSRLCWAWSGPPTGPFLASPPTASCLVTKQEGHREEVERAPGAKWAWRGRAPTLCLRATWRSPRSPLSGRVAVAPPSWGRRRAAPGPRQWGRGRRRPRCQARRPRSVGGAASGAG